MADEDDGGERSEDPTQKRLDDALERGDVAKSQEVNTWFMIAGAPLFSRPFRLDRRSQTPLKNLIANSWMIRTRWCGPSDAGANIWNTRSLPPSASPILMLVLTAIAGNVLQHRLVWSGESLKPKLSKFRRWKAPSASSANRQWQFRQGPVQARGVGRS